MDVGRGVHAGVERRPDEKMSSCRLMCIRKQFVSDEEGFLTSFLIPDEIRSELATAIIKNKWNLLRLEAVGMSLEEIFLRLTTTEETGKNSINTITEGAPEIE